jgi:hypothetical protein
LVGRLMSRRMLALSLQYGAEALTIRKFTSRNSMNCA